MVHETINNITKKDDACKNMTKKIFFTVFSECYDSIFFSRKQLVPSINAKFTTKGKKIFCI